MIRVLWAALCVAVIFINEVHAEPTLRVTAFSMATDVQARQPVGVATRFGLGVERLWAFAQIDNPGQKTEIQMVWRHGGRARSRATLSIGHSPAWRTWSRRRILRGDAGDWTVEVLDAEGRQLGLTRFSVGTPREQTIGVGVPKPPAAHEDAPSAPDPPSTKVPKHPPSDVAKAKTPKPPAKLSKGHIAPKDAPPSATPTCRALLNLELEDGSYQVADVHIGAEVSVTRAPGLIIRDKRTTHALRLVRHEVEERGRGGIVQRHWDLLMGMALPKGFPVTWHGYPASLAPPNAPTPRGYEEHNTLKILGTSGPFIGLRASLSGRGPRGTYDHSRFVTLRAPGRVADLRTQMPSLKSQLRAAVVVAWPEAAQRPQLNGHDLRRVAPAPSPTGWRLHTRLPCCQGQRSTPVDFDFPAPQGFGFEADALGLTRASGCAVGVIDGFLVAGTTQPLPVALPGARPKTLLGVYWVKLDDPFRVEQLVEADRRLGR